MTRSTARAGFSPLAFLLLAVLLVSLPARAALFDDDEARKRIEAVRVHVDEIERSIAKRLDALESRNAALVDLFKDVEQLKADIAKLRGQYEVLTYELEQAQKRHRDLYLDLDSRLRKLEGGPGNAAGAADGGAAPGTASGTGDAAPASGQVAGTLPPVGGAAATGGGAVEQRAYDTALDQFKSGNYATAVVSFQAFTRTYPKSPLAPSAIYWTGNAQYAQRDFRAAIATQRQLIAAYPDSQKVPDALLNIASCQLELGDSAAARKTLEEVSPLRWS